MTPEFIHTFIHYKDLHDASSRRTTQKRFQTQFGRINVDLSCIYREGLRVGSGKWSKIQGEPLKQKPSLVSLPSNRPPRYRYHKPIPAAKINTTLYTFIPAF